MSVKYLVKKTLLQVFLLTALVFVFMTLADMHGFTDFDFILLP